ncbi:MAG TPA: CvpA family protein, partial [Pyrinomonadaceae bacterium]|nr:CvpA family protein [Pyrinomonadaceae bacterium]
HGRRLRSVPWPAIDRRQDDRMIGGMVRLAETVRGGVVESIHHGVVAVADADGRLVAGWGDVDTVTYPRSSLKPIQAVGLIESGAFDALGLDEAHLAMACASHRAEPEQVALVGDWLRRLGLFESQAAAHAGGFLLVAGVALVVGLVVGETLRAGLRRARLEWFDRALGALFGLVRGLALCSVVYLALVAFPVRLATVEQARTAPALAEGARLLALCTSQELRARFLDGYRRLLA